MYIKSKNSEVLSAMLHKCIAEIAQATQSSASAVSKVMNHRGGVQADRRYQIYRYIAEHAIEVPAPPTLKFMRFYRTSLFFSGMNSLFRWKANIWENVTS